MIVPSKCSPLIRVGSIGCMCIQVYEAWVVCVHAVCACSMCITICVCSVGCMSIQVFGYSLKFMKKFTLRSLKSAVSLFGGEQHGRLTAINFKSNDCKKAKSMKILIKRPH